MNLPTVRSIARHSLASHVCSGLQQASCIVKIELLALLDKASAVASPPKAPGPDTRLKYFIVRDNSSFRAEVRQPHRSRCDEIASSSNPFCRPAIPEHEQYDGGGQYASPTDVWIPFEAVDYLRSISTINPLVEARSTLQISLS